MLDIKLKYLIKILNADYEDKGKYVFITYNKYQINKNGKIEIYIDYENSNGVYSSVILVDYTNSLDKLYESLIKETKYL